MSLEDRSRALRDAARVAADFTMKPDRRIHPDISWDQMNENAKMVAHITAQQIAMAIMELVEVKHEQQ